MSSVARRTVRSVPYRDAAATWSVVVELLTGTHGAASQPELAAVAGIAASIIADQGPQNAPIIATCDGPRARIYCLYNDDAVDGSEASEDAFGFDPLNGDWRVSLPCHKDDLPWVQSALAKLSSRITARDVDTRLEMPKAAAKQTSPILDPTEFLGS